MRKVLFKRFEYVDGNRVFKDEREGYFHGLHIEGRGCDYAVIEDCITGENYQIEPCDYKFIPSPEKEPIDWEQRRFEAAKAAMQAYITHHGGSANAYLDAENSVFLADALINHLKNTPVK